MSYESKWDLLGEVLSLLPFSADRIESTSKENDKLFISTNDNKRYILKLVELPPVKEHTDIGECKTFFYINPETKEPVYRPKIAYETEKEAIHAAMVVNVQDKTIHKRQAYKCSYCHKYHIGRGQTVLTQDDKLKLKIKHNIR